MIPGPQVNAVLMDSLIAADVWSCFARDLGAEALLKCYGWAFHPIGLRRGETAWQYGTQDGRDLIGWGSLIKDPTTDIYWHASGIFPAFARQGYRHAIRAHLCDEAFTRGASAVSLSVLGSNPDHLARCRREAAAGSLWQPSGYVWRPAPGYTIFTLLREDYMRQAAEPFCCCAHLWTPGHCPTEVHA